MVQVQHAGQAQQQGTETPASMCTGVCIRRFESDACSTGRFPVPLYMDRQQGS